MRVAEASRRADDRDRERRLLKRRDPGARERFPHASFGPRGRALDRRDACRRDARSSKVMAARTAGSSAARQDRAARTAAATAPSSAPAAGRDIREPAESVGRALSVPDPSREPRAYRACRAGTADGFRERHLAEDGVEIDEAGVGASFCHIAIGSTRLHLFVVRERLRISVVPPSYVRCAERT